MPPDLSPEAWAQIRHDYEHTARPVEDICIEHGISTGTLRDRMRRWRWTRRRTPIPREGPPPSPAVPPSIAAAQRPMAQDFDDAMPRLADIPPYGVAVPRLAYPPQPHGQGASAPAASEDERPIVPRLQGAVARLLPAMEATVTKLGTQGLHPREMEQAARALGSLTRTLRELNGLLDQHQAGAADAGEDEPVDIEERRRELARKLNAFVDARNWERLGCAAATDV